MNKSLARTWVVTILMIFGLMANITYVQGFDAQNLRDDPLNARRYQDRFTTDRGPILAMGERLAWSEKIGGKDGGKAKYRRRYASGPVFSPATGYFSLFSDSGLERAENHILDGTDSRLAVNNFIDKLIGRPVRGGIVEATIDPAAQRAAYSGLKASTDLRGAAVALDAKTGAILVMASYPSYDPNDLASTDVRQVEKEFKRLQADRFRQPLLNKAANETFAPGSSFKAVVASAALANGMTKNSKVPAGTSYTPPGTTRAIRNSHDSGSCGMPATTLIDAFAQSCNTTFAELGAERLGNRKVRAEADGFGYDQPVELAPKMKSAASSFPEADRPGTALESIGQGDNRATVLHLAMVAAAAVNDGEVMRPFLVRRVRAHDEDVVEETKPALLHRAMDSGDARQLREMMVAVVRSGTARNLQGDDVAGKTGTADVDGRVYNERWFAGFGPIEDPRFAVAVVTEGTGDGASAAGPIVAGIVRVLRNR